MSSIFISNVQVNLNLVEKYWGGESGGRPAIWVSFLPKSDGHTPLSQAIIFANEAARGRAFEDIASQIKRLQGTTGTPADPEDQLKALIESVGYERSAGILANLAGATGDATKGEPVKGPYWDGGINWTHPANTADLSWQPT